MQEAMRARSAEASRELEMQAHALIGGMQAMGLHEEFTHTFFASKAKVLQASFTRGQHKYPVLGSLSLGELTQKLMYGVRASVYRARLSEQDRGIRVMRALDPKAQAREGITRVVIAENKSGSGLEATVVLNTFKELLPSGDVNLNAIRKMGGICESSRVEPPAAVFAVDLDATLATSGPMFNFLRTTATERVTLLNNTDDATPIETIWTVESGFDAHVALIGEEARGQARAFSLMCATLQLDKGTRDSILTECVRNSPGMAPWKQDILWVRLQRECFIGQREGQGSTKATLHENDWGMNSNKAPKLLINVCSAEVLNAMVKVQPEVRIFLGTEYGDLAALSGTVSGNVRNDTAAGLAQAKERFDSRVAQALMQGESLLQNLQAASERAIEGNGMDAAQLVYECQVKINMAEDAACLFLRARINELTEEVKQNSSKLSIAGGLVLAQRIREWQREFEVQRAPLDRSMVQLKFFPPDPPAALQGARQWWKGRPSLERLRSRLQKLLTDELGEAKIICTEPILNQHGQWNTTEGVILHVQCKEGLMQRYDSNKQGQRVPNKVSILHQGTTKAGVPLRVVWMSDPEGDMECEDKVNVEEGLRKMFSNADGIWIPKNVAVGQSTIMVYLRKENDVPPPKLSILGESRGEFDIRNLSSLLGCSRDAVEGAVEIMGNLLEGEAIAPVCECNGMTLFIAKDFAIELLATAQSPDEADAERVSFLLTVKEGEGVRESVLAQLGSTLCPLLVAKLPAGVWMESSLRGGIQGTAPSDGEGMVQDRSTGRWWYEVLVPHVLSRTKRHDLAEIIVSSAMEGRSGIQAIRKGGGVLLVQSGSFWLTQLVQASGVVPGSCIPTNILPIDSDARSRFETALWSRAAALGAKWEECAGETEGTDCTQDLGEVVGALEQDPDGSIRREIWLNLPPLSYSTLIRVGDTKMRPEPQGTGIVFVPHSGDIVGSGADILRQCKAETWSESKPSTRVFTTAQLLPTWDVATFGYGATRMLRVMVEEGRATILKAVGGSMVVMAERATWHGKEILFRMSDTHSDPSLTTSVKGTPTQVSALRVAVETASIQQFKKKMKHFFEIGHIGVLTGTKMGDDGLLQQTSTAGVREDICLRSMLKHPVLYDSRGLRAMEDVMAAMTLTVRMVAVGHERQHLLLGVTMEGGLMPAWPDHDPRFAEWNTAEMGFEFLLLQGGNNPASAPSPAREQQALERRDSASREQRRDSASTAGKKHKKGDGTAARVQTSTEERDETAGAENAMEEDRIHGNSTGPNDGNRTGQESNGLGGTAEKGNGGDVGGSAQPHSFATFIDDEDGSNDADL